MNPGELIQVNEHLWGGNDCSLAIYLGEFRDSLFGTLAKIFLVSGSIKNVHHTHLRKI